MGRRKLMTEEELSQDVSELFKKLFWRQNKAELWFGGPNSGSLTFCNDYFTARTLLEELVIIPMLDIIKELQSLVKSGKSKSLQVFLDGFYLWLELYFSDYDKYYPYIRQIEDSFLYRLYIEEDDLFQLLKNISFEYSVLHKTSDQKDLIEYLEKLNEFVKNPQVIIDKNNEINNQNVQRAVNCYINKQK
jgi:glutaredoxin